MAGAAIGVGTAIFGPRLSDTSALNAEIVLAVTSLFLAVLHLRSQFGVGVYLMEVAALWLAFVVGWKMFSGNANPDFQIYAAYRFAACAAAGAALILVFRRAPGAG
jgi:hypothetical protein